MERFVTWKGLSLETVGVDIVAGENRRAPYLTLNPSGGTPLLELDSGEYVAESVAICEYLEELFPDPPLIGRSPEERAKTRMWVRRVDLGYVQPLTLGFRGAEGHAFFKDRVRCLPEAAAGLKALAADGLAFLDKQLAGRQFLAGGRATLADILLQCFVEFAERVGQAPDAALGNLASWRTRLNNLGAPLEARFG